MTTLYTVFRYLKTTRSLIGLLFLALTFSAYTKEPTTKGLSKPTNGFIENKGQNIDQNNKPNPAVLYLLNTPGMNVQLRKGGFSYDLYSIEKSKVKSQKSKLQFKSQNFAFRDSTPLPPGVGAGGGVNFHRIDFDLLNLNPDCEIITSEPSPGYLNYFNAYTPPEGITHVHTFQKISYKNLYQGIDLEFIPDTKTGFKYNFIIREGGNINDIKVRISGCEILKIEKGSLFIHTLLGDIKEYVPESYFLTPENKQDTRVKFYKVEDNIYGLSMVDHVPIHSILVIDPTTMRIYGTYYGGGTQDDPECMAIDHYNCVYVAGSTLSFTNIATAGAYQSTKPGFWRNGFLVKFEPGGNRLWGTYYGGSYNGAEYIYSCAVDIGNNIYIAGFTTSDTGIATPGAHQTVFGGGNIWDGFLTKFNSSGNRLWATYYGGTDDEEVYGLATDKLGNTYIAGQASSNTNISTTGSYQPTLFFPSTQDAFIAKFDSNGVRQWGTYYGGENGDRFQSCCVDTNGNLYLEGFTSSSLNIASPGAVQPTFAAGITDCFFVAFTPAGQRLWATYHGGPSEDYAGGCSADDSGHIYFTGYTKSISGIASPGSYQQAFGGIQDGFMAKFNSLGQQEWATYYGGSDIDYVSGSRVNRDGFVFISGATLSNNNIATPNAAMPNRSGDWDAFLGKFNAGGSRQWATYFGDTQYDYGVGCDYINDDTIYLVGVTLSLINIATVNGFQKTYGGGDDSFLEKFIECWPIAPAQPISGPASVCQNTNGVVYSTTALAHAVNYAWTLPTGVVITSGAGTTSITVAFSGTAMSGNIVVKGLNKCNEPGDSSVLAVAVHSRPIPSITGVDSICRYQSSLFITQSGMTNYIWAVSPGGSFLSGGTSSSDSARVKWTTLGANWVRVNYTNNNNCSGLVAGEKDVWVKQEGSSLTTTPLFNTICSGDSIHIILTASPPVPVFSWVASGSSPSVTGYSGGSGTRIDQKLINNGAGTETVTYSITPLGPGCPGPTSDYIVTVNPKLPVSITIVPSSNPVCAGASVTFTATPMNGGTSPSYQWKVNGITVGTNISTYSYIPVNGDQVKCILTSSEMCTSNNPATSNTLSMTINNNLLVGISIAASANPVCAGIQITFIATPTNGGSSPQYQWKVNGINVGTNNSTYIFTPLSGDQVLCMLTSNLICTSNNPATSNILSITINDPPIVTFIRCFDSITTTNAKPIKLKGGIPLGGTYSGLGVNSVTGYLNPAAAGTGTKTITYSYTNSALCSSSNTCSLLILNSSLLICGNTLTDPRDGKAYPTVQIGSQCWMAANLNYGTMILSSSHQRDNCLPEKYCYNDLTANCELRTANYQWDELMQYDDTPGLQGLCPPGWHVPTENDWNTLFANYINNAFTGSPLKYSGYSGFNALLTGARFMNKTWSFDGFATYFWSSTLHGSLKAWAHAMNDYDPSVAVYPSNRSNAFTVRCLKD